MRVSLRLQLGVVLIVMNVFATSMVALLAYRAANDALTKEAVDRVAEAARGRAAALDTFVADRQRRLDGFLASAQSLCAERGPSGYLGWEIQCIRIALGGLYRAEEAHSAELVYRGERLTSAGPQLSTRARSRPGVASVGTGDRGVYYMSAIRGDLSLRASFPLDDFNAIMNDRSGLDRNGELFLTDAAGYRLTEVDRASSPRFPPIAGVAASCGIVAPATREIMDDRGLSVISGLQRTTGVGGGCVVANLTSDAATAPIRRLTGLLIFASIALMLAAAVISILAARMAARSINRLVFSARQLAAGRFDAPVHESGPSEVRHLAQTFSSMASSIRDLVTREQHARREAEGASRMKDEFLAMVSHELRTPLNAILGWATIIARGPSDEARVQKAVRVIERNARIQSQMIEELLDVSRISAGSMRLTMTDVAIGPLIDAAIESIRPTAELKAVAVRADVQDPARHLRGDSRRLQQILWNLLSNAVRFTPRGGRVSVSVREVDGTIELRVADTGAGITAELLPHVFERFRQGDSGTTRAHGGLGLGLAIVRDLVSLHGGTVEAHSEGEGRGAVFVVRLPAATTPPRIEPAVARRGQPRSLAGARVLVVDDDPDAREVLRTILEDAGAEVWATASARESRAAFAQSHPDLLIADIGMPEEDGYSLIQSIRSLEAGAQQTPAIALTAHTRPEDIEQALAAGFQLHMAKPIDSTRLLASAATLVEQTE